MHEIKHIRHDCNAQLLVLESKVIDAEDRATKVRSDMAITVHAERAVTSNQLKIMNKKHHNKHNQLVGEAESVRVP